MASRTSTKNYLNLKRLRITKVQRACSKCAQANNEEDHCTHCKHSAKQVETRPQAKVQRYSASDFFNDVTLRLGGWSRRRQRGHQPPVEESPLQDAPLSNAGEAAVDAVEKGASAVGSAWKRAQTQSQELHAIFGIWLWAFAATLADMCPLQARKSAWTFKSPKSVTHMPAGAIPRSI